MTKDNALRMAMTLSLEIINLPSKDKDYAKKVYDACKAALSDAVTLPDGWVSVEDGLPKEFKSVIAFGKLRGDKKPVATECYMSKGKWFPVRSSTIHNVTHWIPLPAAPTLNEKG